MQITQLRTEEHRFSFKGGKYVMSHITQEELHIRILKLETADGQVGSGEIVRKSSVDLSEAMAAESSVLESLVGKSIADIPGVCRDYRQKGTLFRGLAFGLETAYLDWLGRQSGLPLYALFGGKRCDPVAEYYSLSCEEPENVAPALRSRALDWQVVQIKLGVGGLEQDSERIRSALTTLSSNQTILADFNGELDVDQALEIISKFDDPRIVWEEPCDNVEYNSEVARQSGQPVMFDQCLEDLQCYTRVAADGLAHSMCIKPPFLGGLELARSARDICVEAGIKVRVDGPWCGHIATAACLHLAVTVPPGLLIAGCDLRQAFDLNEDWGGTKHLEGHRISPCSVPGHGVVLPDGR